MSATNRASTPRGVLSDVCGGLAAQASAMSKDEVSSLFTAEGQEKAKQKMMAAGASSLFKSIQSRYFGEEKKEVSKLQLLGAFGPLSLLALALLLGRIMALNLDFKYAVAMFAGEEFSNSLATTIRSDLGDKAFFTAAVLSMSYSPVWVFFGAWSALATTTMLSSIANYNMVTKAIKIAMMSGYAPLCMHWLAIVLFLIIGVNNLIDDEVKKDEAKDRGGAKVFAHVLSMTLVANVGPVTSSVAGMVGGIVDVVGGASSGTITPMLGGFVGHAVSTALAVVGGRALSARLSNRIGVGISGILFVGFGFQSLMNPM